MIYVTMADLNIDLKEIDQRYRNYLELSFERIRDRVVLNEQTPTWQCITYVDHYMNEHQLRIDYKNVMIWEE